MKKTTKHGRKLRRMGITSSTQEKEVATVVTAHRLELKIADHQPYDHPTNVPDADNIMDGVRDSLHKLANGLLTPADDWSHFYDLCDHIGAGQMRAVEVEGDAAMANEAIAALNAAGQALKRAHERFVRLGSWGLDGPGLVDLNDGIDVAEALMRASTPAQMRRAQKRYFEWRDTTNQEKKAA